MQEGVNKVHVKVQGCITVATNLRAFPMATPSSHDELRSKYDVDGESHDLFHDAHAVNHSTADDMLAIKPWDLERVHKNCEPSVLGPAFAME